MSIPTTYRKKPVTIQAMQWDGTPQGATPIIDWVLAGDGTANYWGPGEWFEEAPDAAYLAIRTLEGQVLASPGDFIIRGVQGEFYPCKPDIFQETYEEVTA